MQTQIEKALNDIANELHEIRKLLEKDMRAPVKGMIDENNQITFLNKPWLPFDIVSTNPAFDILSNNPEAHGRCQDEQG